LGQLARPEALSTLLDLSENPRDKAIFAATMNALGGFQEEAVATRLLARSPTFDATARERILDLLCTRPLWANLLLDDIARGRINPRELRTSHALQIASLNNRDLTARAEKLWGRVPGPGSSERAQRIAEVRGFLAEGDKGNAARGRAVFKENCAICHRLFDEGESIGPDLTGAERKDLNFLLTSLVDPSALIRKEYQSQIVATNDGRVLTGIIVEESAEALTLVDGNRQKTVVPRSQIGALRTSAVSLMPENQLDKLTEEQVRDLFKYLQSNGPTAK
jgi:putative heme-binding domain-containing protein